MIISDGEKYPAYDIIFQTEIYVLELVSYSGEKRCTSWQGYQLQMDFGEKTVRNALPAIVGIVIAIEEKISEK